MSARPSGVGDSGSAMKCSTAASMMLSALLNSRFSGSRRANTEPHAVVSMASPTPSDRPNRVGSTYGSAKRPYSGSTNCRPMAVRHAPASKGTVPVGSGRARPARFAVSASATSTMPHPSKPHPVNTAKGWSEKASADSSSGKKRRMLRKTENSTPAPNRAGLNETVAGCDR